MEIKFYGQNYVLDLSRTPLTIQESNSILADTMFTKFVFPYEIETNEEVLIKIGDWNSYDSDLETVENGHFFIENRTHIGQSEILSIEQTISGQIDYGFEEIPNYKKKLSELPLENFQVTDIYTYAKDIAGKTYPQTNFTFPRIYSNKYSPDNKMWDAYDGYYNDLKSDGSEMRRNYIDPNDQEIYNVNIIHPMPHFLYILKVGFKDAGFDLKGDILTDEDFLDQYVFSNTQYFSTLAQVKLSGFGFYNDAIVLYWQKGENGISSPVRKIEKMITIPKSGKYNLVGAFTFWLNKDNVYNKAYIEVDGFKVWSKSGTLQERKMQDLNFNFEMQLTENSTVKFYIQYFETFLIEKPIKYNVAAVDLEQNDAPTQESGVVSNLNEIDLRKAVPNMEFGEYVNVAKNWGNYDLVVDGRTIFMNKIKPIEQSEIKDFSFAAVETPKRNFHKNKSFLLKFIDLDEGYKLDSIYFDKDGTKINGTGKDDTKTIEIKGYPLPIGTPKPNGHKTAIVKKDSDDILQLVTYRGLKNGQNNAESRDSLLFPILFEKRWRKWLQQRIKSIEFLWTFLVNPAFFAKYTIKTAFQVYDKSHIIKTWTKNYYPGEDESEDVYQIDIVTETLN